VEYEPPRAEADAWFWIGSEVDGGPGILPLGLRKALRNALLLAAGVLAGRA
jgi:hypothetical protein